jgi:hypothetical protein
MIYFEKLTLLIYLLSLANNNIFKKKFQGEITNIYFIDSSPLAKRFLVPMLIFFGKNIQRLDFKMMDVVDSNGEIVRTRIAREDLTSFKIKIIDSDAYKGIYHESWKVDSINDYIDKHLIGDPIYARDSISRVLFIINVIKWHAKKFDYLNPALIVKDRPWFEIYKEYSGNLNIELFAYKHFYDLSDFKKIILKYHWLYKFTKNITNTNSFIKNISSNFFKKADKNSLINMLFLDGRGNINLSNDGLQSDFFWQLNSNFPKENIILQHHNESEKEYLLKNGVYSIPDLIYSRRTSLLNYRKPKTCYSRIYKNESKLIKNIINIYNFERNYWSSMFKKYDAKIFFTWYKYSSKHIAQHDAIQDNGGISVMWQMALDTYENSECQIVSDISFVYSKFSHDIDQKLDSKTKYSVIVGYPQDYASSFLKVEAQKLREKLTSNGAKKIIFAIDENSTDDSRWHTGHELQRENYSFILQKVLETPWLGVVFKPKASKTLRKRLGPIADLLKEAEATGRCYVFESSAKGRHSSITPVILAGLSADVCIHGHLSAGTAAFECALEGIPSLLINREGVVDSKLLDLPEGSVVFKDWPACIDALMKYLDNPKSINGFGDWSSVIDELDPFRDGKAAYRIGTYLHWLNEGFNKGLDKETVMLNCASRYREEWGEDKIICP